MVNGLPSEVEVITLFVDDIASSKAFYGRVFSAETVWEDAVSSVLKFGGLLINLLERSQAPQLVEPLPVEPSSAGARALLTIRVADVDEACSARDENQPKPLGLVHPTRFERVASTFGGTVSLCCQPGNGTLNQSQESGVASPRNQRSLRY
ncbi:VOC family protein [Bradyrhizobium sp. AZCC 2230]|uniref:VOC family protein n=1 Tax=Bradyrhizobium sp. AZCC 2230 TaxID=3117021 RepID=UPI002FF30A18